MIYGLGWNSEWILRYEAFYEGKALKHAQAFPREHPGKCY